MPGSRPASASDVVLFTASWCPYCRQARAYLVRSRIKYEDVDIETPAGKARFAAVGGGGVPLLVYKGEQLRGYSELAYDFFFARQQ
jgi:glutaredoxin